MSLFAVYTTSCNKTNIKCFPNIFYVGNPKLTRTKISQGKKKIFEIKDYKVYIIHNKHTKLIFLSNRF